MKKRKELFYFNKIVKKREKSLSVFDVAFMMHLVFYGGEN